MKSDPVKYNEYYNKWLTKNGRLGKHPDQYPTLKQFMSDIWKRYQPYGGKQYFDKCKLYQLEDSDELICKDKSSKFYNEIVQNYYLTRSIYDELKQHYFCNNRKHKKY